MVGVQIVEITSRSRRNLEGQEICDAFRRYQLDDVGLITPCVSEVVLSAEKIWYNDDCMGKTFVRNPETGGYRSVSGDGCGPA